VYGEPQNKENTLIYVTDLDGTLAKIGHRLHFIKDGNKDWDSFFDACDQDEPIKPIISIIQALQADQFDIIVLTGRPERTRRKTLYWLSQYGIHANKMYMRKDGDHREDYIVKAELYDQMLDEHPGHMVMAVFEDRQQVVDALRAKGALVLQVAKGDY
jgi:hydroxymethylpyrimidine pyrophosphatase-like HAD family hydrolase